MEIEEIRKQLDDLDKELIEIISKRIQLIPEVAEYKKKNNLDRYQPKREEEIYGNAKKIAEEKGVNPELIKKILSLLIEESHRIEKEIMD